MPVRKIIRMGHPTLRSPAKTVPENSIGSSNIACLIQDMIETLHDYGGIGLAAPQINEPTRIAIIDIPEGASRYGKLQEIPLCVFINPKLTVLGKKVAGYWEGCLSVPGLRGFVERPQHIRVDYLDLKGKPQRKEMTGFTATVIQHEFDHLDGHLYLDHITDPKLLMFEDEYEKYILSERPEKTSD